MSFSSFDPGFANIRMSVQVEDNWKDSDFNKLQKILTEHKYLIDPNQLSLEPILNLLRNKTDLLIRLLENPILIEHEAFTELLKATFHLREELVSRSALSGLPDSDMTHLTVDAIRVYGLLTKRWTDYMFYLKKRYPYLFSFALRANPFDENRSPVVK